APAVSAWASASELAGEASSEPDPVSGLVPAVGVEPASGLELEPVSAGGWTAVASAPVRGGSVVAAGGGGGAAGAGGGCPATAAGAPAAGAGGPSRPWSCRASAEAAWPGVSGDGGDRVSIAPPTSSRTPDGVGVASVPDPSGAPGAADVAGPCAVPGAGAGASRTSGGGGVAAGVSAGAGGAVAAGAAGRPWSGRRSTPLQRGQRSGGRSVAGSVATSAWQCRQLMNMALFNHAAGRRRRGRGYRRMPSIRTQSPSVATASPSNHSR